MTHFPKTALCLRVPDCLLVGGRASGDGDDALHFLLPEDILRMSLPGQRRFLRRMSDSGRSWLFRVKEWVTMERGNVWSAVTHNDTWALIYSRYRTSIRWLLYSLKFRLRLFQVSPSFPGWCAVMQTAMYCFPTWKIRRNTPSRPTPGWLPPSLVGFTSAPQSLEKYDCIAS
jgi:hypothetical protein